MPRRFLLISFVFILLFVSCTEVPLTGRRQLRLLPDGLLLNMSMQAFNDFMSQNPSLPPDNPKSVMVQQSGERIANAVTAYLQEINMERRIRNFAWEFKVVLNEDVNAWVMPGGKVVFYTGIFPLAKDENGIAVVMGHEIAHAVANHGNERMSQQLAVVLGAITLDVALREKPQETRDVFLLAYGVGGTLGTLAYSRQHEYEADKLGMIFMAMAGYNPNHAIRFWDEMTKLKGPSIPTFLSTHPSSADRVEAMREFLPEAMKYYKPR